MFLLMFVFCFFFSSRRRHTRCALVTGVQTCAFRSYLAIADRYRPRWAVWENVPGVLSSNGGRDFGTFLGALGELGYGFAYRVLDAQHFGVPPRRRRVFVVGYLGDWRPAAAVLFERESLLGHPAPRRDAGEAVSGGALAGTSRSE